MIYPQNHHRSNINGQYFLFANTNPNVCYIAMRQPKMSDTVTTTQPGNDTLQAPTEAPSYGADAGSNDKDMADSGEVVGEIENAPNEKRLHKQDVVADDAVSKEKILKLLNTNVATTPGPDSGPITLSSTSTPEPASLRPDYPA